MAYAGTVIDGVSLSPERLEIRGHDLADMIRDMPYFDAMAITLEVDLPFAEEFFQSCFVAVDPEDAPNRIARMVAESGGVGCQAVIAALMSPSGSRIDKVVETYLRRPSSCEESILRALAVIAVLPVYLAFGVQGSRAAETLRAAQAGCLKYIDRVCCLFTTDLPTQVQVTLLRALLIAWQGGLGCVPPSILMPRVAAGTGVPDRVGFAAGFAAAGPHHIGACEESLELLLQLMPHLALGQDNQVRAAIAHHLDRHARIPGVGHPLFDSDPRASCLRGVASSLKIEHDALRLYDIVAQYAMGRLQLYPNVDLISAALFIVAGIDQPQVASGLALCGRAIGMLAHMRERRRKPAFGLNKTAARRQLRLLPTNWL